MDDKEAFQIAKKHLLCQMKKSEAVVDQTFKCLYRGPNGLKCAVGALIPDDEYKAWHDNASLSDVARETSLSLLSLHMLRDLQALHDHEPIHKWALGLERLELKYGPQESSV